MSREHILTAEFIVEMLAACVKDKQFFEGIKPHLKPNFLYDDDAQYLWGLIKKLYTRSNGVTKRLSVPSIRQNIEKDNKKGRLDGAMDLLDQVKETVVEDKEGLLKDFEEFVKISVFREVYEEMGKAYNQGDREEAFRMFTERAMKFADFNIFGAKFDTVFSSFTDRTFERFTRQREAYIIPTGIAPIDDYTGGHYTGETELWLGDSGVGKSKLLAGRSIATAKWGGVVLHVQAEGTHDQCMDNFDACWTGQNYYDLKQGHFDNERLEKFMKAADKYRGEVVVKTVTMFGGCTMAQVRQWCIEVIKQYGRLDHLVIDYLELIRPDDTDRHGSGDEYNRNAMTASARLLKNLAVEFNLLGTSAAQSHTIDKEFTDNPNFVLNRYNIGKNKRILESFSYFYTINQTSDERKVNRARIYVDKLRELQGGQIWLIKQSLRNSRFYDHKGTLELDMEEDDTFSEEEILEENNKKKYKSHKSKIDKLK